MHFHLVSIFPEIYQSFLTTSLIQKAQDKWLIHFSSYNPRDFCHDKHKQVDDEIYGWWHGILMKAQPIIDAISHIISSHSLLETNKKRLLIDLQPSSTQATQQLFQDVAQKYEHIILVNGRYEWIDHRFQLYCEREFPEQYLRLSLGTFILLGWEVASMCCIEAIARLLPGVIKEEASRQQESYTPQSDHTAIEHPQYTRPEIVEWMSVPEILVSWHHKNIEQRKRDNTTTL